VYAVLNWAGFLDTGFEVQETQGVGRKTKDVGVGLRMTVVDLRMRAVVMRMRGAVLRRTVEEASLSESVEVVVEVLWKQVHP
jgi:hypothetical protein